MKHSLLVILAIGLLAFVACGDGDGAPSATDTRVLEVPVTVTPSEPTATSEPEATQTLPPIVQGSCPIRDVALCSVAESFERALGLGQFEAVVANTKEASQTCSGLEQIGPCFGMDEGFVLSGYLVGIDASDSVLYLSSEEYLAALARIAEADPSAADEYGDGAWRIAAIIDEAPDEKVIVTTTIGPDPIYRDAAPDRRVFLFRTQRTEGAWSIVMLLTTSFIDQNLTGTFPDGSLVPGWLRWGGE